MFPRFHRVLALTATVPLTLGLALTSPPQAFAVTPAKLSTLQRAHLAADWQGRQLNKDGAIPSEFPGFVDWGLTIDTGFALVADGQQPRRLAKLRKAVAGHYFTDYATFDGTISANAMAKTLVLAKLLGANPRAFGGHDLRKLVRNRIAGTAAGFEHGRLRDKTTADLPDDFSNTFGQALGVIGLARTGRVPRAVVSYLLKQRCSDGFFRLTPVVRQTCDDSGSPADIDATAFAIQALVTARAHGATVPAATVSSSARWLKSVQKTNGSFSETVGGPSNSNSTGVAAQALHAAGLNAAAA